MKRNIRINSGISIGLALAAGLGLSFNSSASEESIHGDLVYIDVKETAYIARKVECVAPFSEGETPKEVKTRCVEGPPGAQEVSADVRTNDKGATVLVFTDLVPGTFETGTRVWQNSAGICYMQKRTLVGMNEHSGVQFPKIHEKMGSADCETLEFHTAADFQ